MTKKENEAMIFLIIIGICAISSLILGLLMKRGKGLMLIAGYNTMSKEDRNKIDKKELSKTAGNLMLRMTFELVLLGITIYLGLTWAAIVLLIVTIADPCASAVRMSRKMPKSTASKNSMVIAIITTAVIFIAVGILFYYGEKEPVVNILDNNIQVKAMYGLNVSFSDVINISLIEKNMKDIGIGHRNNGYGGFGETLKGHFNSQALGNYLLFVKAGSSPTIWIERNNKEDIYISFSNGENTKILYQELVSTVFSR